jgi:hypothetical protein
MLFLENCRVGGNISGLCDLNKDESLEIFVSKSSGNHGEIEYLWIISNSDDGGRLFNAVDDVNLCVAVRGSVHFNYSIHIPMVSKLFVPLKWILKN